MAQRGEVAASPGARRVAVVYPLVEDALLLRMLLHRHGEPARLAVDADLAAVLVVAALELHVVEHDEQVHLRHAVQVAQPGDEVRLVDGDDHAEFSFWRNPASLRRAPAAIPSAVLSRTAQRACAHA